MSENEKKVEVGQVYKDNDTRITYPFIEVHALIPSIEGEPKTHVWAKRRKTETGDGSLMVKIKIERLLKGGSRGYTLIRGVVEPQPSPAPAI